MARNVHLVRHGEAENPEEVVYDSLPGFPLSEVGAAQARSVSRYLGSQPIVAVWSSPLQRALETAAAIANRCGLSVSVDEDLIEWSLLSRWAGTPWADLPGAFPGELEAYLERPHELDLGETLEELADRMVTAIKRINEHSDAGDVVIVGHQDPIQVARLALTGRDLSSLHKDKPTHACAITLAPGPPWRELTMWKPEPI